MCFTRSRRMSLIRGRCRATTALMTRCRREGEHTTMRAGPMRPRPWWLGSRLDSSPRFLLPFRARCLVSTHFFGTPTVFSATSHGLFSSRRCDTVCVFPSLSLSNKFTDPLLLVSSHVVRVQYYDAELPRPEAKPRPRSTQLPQRELRRGQSWHL